MFSLLTLILALSTILYKYQRNFYIVYKTLKRDLRGARGYFRLNFVLWRWARQNKTIENEFSVLAKRHPDKVAFYFEDQAWTFSQSDEYINKIARYFQKQGFKKGDCVALILENRPEYIFMWMGLSRIGVITALINTNLINDPLLHSIKIVNSKSAIFGTNYIESIKGISDKLDNFKLYQFNETENDSRDILKGCEDLRKGLENVSSSPLENKPQLNVRDPIIYIYTSGTTGLPKAAIITNLRFAFMAMGLYYMTNLKSNDIIYGPLPLYHSAACIAGSGQCLIKGLTFVIRKKFSASNYWKDCAKYNCTVAQYVGEVCRYILAAQGTSESVKHSVRAIYGNGLRPQIWSEYVNKFNIKQVFEFYGATEGISNMINIDNKVGSIGFIPAYFKWLYPIILVKCDETTGEPIRNSDGFCITCEINEPGLVIGRINPKKELLNFKGYIDKQATNQKILKNVFSKNDLYFNSGDVLVGDEFGYYFFKDRLGDTFRWKGENVSTSEVEAVISNIVQLNDAVVYGVQLPHSEGRAGMAAIVDLNGSLNVDSLSEGLKQNLPSYAIPIFIRILKSVPKTGTFKLKKYELQSESFNVNKLKDNLYFYNSKLGKYIPLTTELYDKIVSGSMSV